MGSRKLKRKKLKNRKSKKFYKLKATKLKKSTVFGSLTETDCEDLLEKNSLADRLNPKKCFRSYIGEENVSNMKHFAKVREGYFRNLKTVVYNNCVFFDSVLTEETLENLTLELEKNALLACLRVKIYKKSMLKIIKAIKKCTKEKQMHKDVKKLLPGLSQEKNDQAELLKPTNHLLQLEVGGYNKISTSAFTGTKNNCMEQSVHKEDSSNPVINDRKETYSDHQNGQQINSNIQSLYKGKVLLFSQSNNNSNELSLTRKSDLRIPTNVIASHSIYSNISNSCINNNSLSYISNHNKEQHKVDSLSLSKTQLQKFVEQTLNDTEKVHKQKQDEHERACIAQILEGDDSMDEKLNDSLSDNENESIKYTGESNLMDHLKKMRELFGMEDAESKRKIISEKSKQSHKVNHVNVRSQCPTVWRYEKFIHLHKYSIIAQHMNIERRQINRKLFLELFGEDSDEEHEMEYSSTDKYRSTCTERISSWVVQYLMPFYHEKRILGRDVFKHLGHYISDIIIDKIQYPDEWTVKYFVSKFFPPKKKYVCVADILNFQVD